MDRPEMHAWTRDSLTRRRFLELGATTGVGLAIAACAPAPAAAPPTPAAAAAAAPTFDWRKYAGTELNGVYTNNAQNALFKSKVDEFQSLTGIQVTYQDLDLASMRDKQNVAFTASAGTIDVWHTLPNNE